MDNMICKIHNEPALFCERDAQQNQVYLCRFCVQQRLKIQNIDDAVNEEKQALKQLEIQFDQSIKQLQDFAQDLEQFTKQIQSKLLKLKQQVEQHLSNIYEKKNYVKNISNEFTNLQLNKINEQKNIINNSQSQIILQLNNQIKDLEICTKFDQFYQLLNYLSIEESNSKLNQLIDIKKIGVIEKKLDYQLMQRSSYKQNEYCYVIAFNKDASVMIVGCDKLIKVFEFKNEKLSLIQSLNGHSKQVQCFKLMKKSNQFISGSRDTTMIIWKLGYNNLWQCIQVLKGHTYSSWCIIMNQNEDLLISGSYDNTIKFWKNQNNTWNCNQSIDCQSPVYSISLNEQEDKLIASVEDKQILLIQLQGKDWMIKSKISVEQHGCRLCYINQNQFVFQPRAGQNLQIFDYDAKDQTYKKREELQYQNKETDDDCLFPIQYLSQIGLIMVKNGNYVHLIKRNKYGQLTVEQSLNFNTFFVCGCISDDGRYIATWDVISKEIQIRKFEF